jgi:hypothetical protein
MKPFFRSTAAAAKSLITLICIALLVPGTGYAEINVYPQSSVSSVSVSKIPADQLDALVSPIALYPDPLLAQTLAASTYPLEIVELQQWLARHPNLKDKELVDAVSKQPWDPSVQALAGLPEVVNRLANDIQWTTDLGNAFLAQQADVMEAVQRMRQMAVDRGTLKSTEQQTVDARTVENKTVIVVEQADPAVIYVPSYDPYWVWGPPLYYPYPAIYYPPWGYYPYGYAVSFGIGVVMGAFWAGGWGWGCGWGYNYVYVNPHNHFYRDAYYARGGYYSRGGYYAHDGYHAGYAVPRGNIGEAARNTWQHDPQHRGGTPYPDRTTATRFGGTARGESLGSRQAIARQQIARQGANVSTYRAIGERTTNQFTGGSAPTRGSAGTAVNNSSASRSSSRSYGSTSNSRVYRSGASSNRSYGSTSNSRVYRSGTSSRTYGSVGNNRGSVLGNQGMTNRSTTRSYSGSNRSASSGGNRSFSAPSSRGSAGRSTSGAASRGSGSRGGGRR